MSPDVSVHKVLKASALVLLTRQLLLLRAFNSPFMNILQTEKVDVKDAPEKLPDAVENSSAKVRPQIVADATILDSELIEKEINLNGVVVNIENADAPVTPGHRTLPLPKASYTIFPL